MSILGIFNSDSGIVNINLPSGSVSQTKMEASSLTMSISNIDWWKIQSGKEKVRHKPKGVVKPDTGCIWIAGPSKNLCLDDPYLGSGI